MNLRQDARLNMYFAVKDYLTTNTALVTSLPNFPGFFTTFLNGITHVQSCAELQMFDKSGFKTNKSQLKSTLVMLAADASHKIQAYAKFTNNQLLLSETKFTDSDLKNASDNALRDMAQCVYDRVQSNLAALAPYGISAATQTALLGAITSFVAAIPKTRIGAIDSKQGTFQLNNAFTTTDAALKNIDMVVKILALSQPVFYEGYLSARKLIVKGTNSLSLKGLVRDAATGEPIKGATLTFSFDPSVARAKGAKPVKDIVKKSADKGRFSIKSMPTGVYLVTVTKAGYADQVVSIAVADGDLTDLIIDLVKN